ncbi:MAG: hypothetical protein NVSMB57_02600 [Actinomycetota bacterium]
MKTRAIAFSLVCLALLLGACGGGKSDSAGADSGSKDSSSSQSKEEFVKKIDGICAETNTKIEALKAPGDPQEATAEQLPEWEKYLTAAFAAFHDESVALKDAGHGPDDGKEDYLAFVNGRLKSIKALQTENIAAHDGKLDEFKAAAKAAPEEDKDKVDAATKMGAEACAK